MNSIDIKFTLSDKNIKFLKQSLETYNFSKNEYLNPIKYQRPKEYFGYYAYVDGNLAGGSFGWIDDCCWLWLDLLYIEDKYRKLDIGTMLIEQVEEFASIHQCVGIRLETWSFQARGFYEKNGYTVYAQLENHPPKAIDYFLKKELIKDEKDFPRPI